MYLNIRYDYFAEGGDFKYMYIFSILLRLNGSVQC